MSVVKENVLYHSKALPLTVFETVIDNSWFVTPHWHEFAEILYFIDSDASIQINNEYYTVSTGDIVFLNSYDIHGIQGVTKHMVIQFDPQLITDSHINFKRIFPKLDSDKIVRSQQDECRHIRRLKEHMQEMYDANIERLPGYELDMRGSMYKIIASIVAYSDTRVYGLTEYQRQKQFLDKLETLLKYIDEHYQENINIEDAARVLNFSPNYFCKFFKRTMGKTFLEYLNFYRCSKAELLLTTGNQTITEIALATGFSSVSYFDRIYKRYKGHKPSMERKNGNTRDSIMAP